MAFLKSKFSRKFIAVIIALIIAVLLTLFLFIRVYIPSEIKKLILDFSEQNNIALSVNSISYNPFYGFTGEQIEISGLPKKGVSNLKVKNIVVSPSLFRSYITGKLVINDIAIRGADLKLSKDILEYSPGKEEKKPTGTETSEQMVKINNISIEDLGISYENSYSIMVNKMKASLKNEDDNNTGIKIKGVINDKIMLSGSIKTNNINKKGEVKAQIQGLNEGGYFGIVRAPYPISLSIESDFEYGESKSLSALLQLNQTKKPSKTKIAFFKLKTDYNKSNDKLNISYFNTSSSLLSLSGEGEIKDISSNPDLLIKAKLKFGDLSEFRNWIQSFRDIDISGSVFSDNLIIESSPDTRSPMLKGLFEARNINYTDRENNSLKGLTGTFKLTADLKSRQITAESEQGKAFKADYAGTKELALRNITGELKAAATKGDYQLKLYNINAGLLDGIINGDLNYHNSQHRFNITSDIEGRNINLYPLRKIIDLPVCGNLKRLSASIKADNEDIESDIILTVNSLNYGDEDNRLSLSELRAVSPLKLEIDNYTAPDMKVSMNGNKLDISGITYAGIESGTSVVSEFELNYNNSSAWDMRIRGKGNNLKYNAFEASLSDYYLDLDIDNKEEMVLSGKLKGMHGYYQQTQMTNISTAFVYRNNSVKLSDLSLELPDYGSIDEARANIKFPENNSKNYEISLSDGGLNLFNNSVSLKKIKGNIDLFTGDKIKVRGGFRANNLNAYGIQMNDTHLNFSYTDDLLKVDELVTKIYNGNLKCTASIELGKEPEDFSLGISYKNASDLMGFDFLDLGKMSLSLEGSIKDKKIQNADGNISFKNLLIHRNDNKSEIQADADIKIKGGTILIENGFINNGGKDPIKVNGKIHDLFSENRGSGFDIPPVSLFTISSMISPLLPTDIAAGEFKGSVSLSLETYNLFEKLSNWKGKLTIRNAGYRGEISKTRFEVGGIEGVITLKDKTVFKNKLADIMGNDLVITKDTYKKYIKQFTESDIRKNGDYLRIKRLQYGFLTMGNLSSVFEIDKEKINLLYFKSELYGGHIYSSGVLRFAGNESYNVSLLVDDLSLRQITDSLPSMQNYISGIVYGLLWFSVGDSYWSINGPFTLWAKDSQDEKRSIGRALLEQLGAKSRFFTKSSRRYDKGIISGYINEGLMTFKNFEISNSFLGYQDLMIHVDSRMNSISVKHLLSVIRELARRAGKGEIQIDIEKKKK